MGYQSLSLLGGLKECVLNGGIIPSLYLEVLKSGKGCRRARISATTELKGLEHWILLQGEAQGTERLADLARSAHGWSGDDGGDEPFMAPLSRVGAGEVPL